MAGREKERIQKEIKEDIQIKRSGLKVSISKVFCSEFCFTSNLNKLKGRLKSNMFLTLTPSIEESYCFEFLY